MDPERIIVMELERLSLEFLIVGPGIKSFFPFWFLSDFYSSFKSCEIRIHFRFRKLANFNFSFTPFLKLERIDLYLIKNKIAGRCFTKF